jgi:hypothetical protein
LVLGMCDGTEEGRGGDASLRKFKEANGDRGTKERHPNHHHDARTAPSAAVASCSSATKGWPEQPDPTKFWIYQVYERWTYSYMSPLLRKGARQTLDDGTHLSSNDLHPIPEAMTSSNLSQQFRYVPFCRC